MVYKINPPESPSAVRSSSRRSYYRAELDVSVYIYRYPSRDVAPVVAHVIGLIGRVRVAYARIAKAVAKAATIYIYFFLLGEEDDIRCCREAAERWTSRTRRVYIRRRGMST